MKGLTLRYLEVNVYNLFPVNSATRAALAAAVAQEPVVKPVCNG